jgi:hypothetical protein
VIVEHRESVRQPERPLAGPRRSSRKPIPAVPRPERHDQPASSPEPASHPRANSEASVQARSDFFHFGQVWTDALFNHSGLTWAEKVLAATALAVPNRDAAYTYLTWAARLGPKTISDASRALEATGAFQYDRPSTWRDRLPNNPRFGRANRIVAVAPFADPEHPANRGHTWRVPGEWPRRLPSKSRRSAELSAWIAYAVRDQLRRGDYKTDKPRAGGIHFPDALCAELFRIATRHASGLRQFWEANGLESALPHRSGTIYVLPGATAHRADASLVNPDLTEAVVELDLGPTGYFKFFGTQPQLAHAGDLVRRVGFDVAKELWARLVHSELQRWWPRRLARPGPAHPRLAAMMAGLRVIADGLDRLRSSFEQIRLDEKREATRREGDYYLVPEVQKDVSDRSTEPGSPSADSRAEAPRAVSEEGQFQRAWTTLAALEDEGRRLGGQRHRRQLGHLNLFYYATDAEHELIALAYRLTCQKYGETEAAQTLRLILYDDPETKGHGPRVIEKMRSRFVFGFAFHRIEEEALCSPNPEAPSSVEAFLRELAAEGEAIECTAPNEERGAQPTAALETTAEPESAAQSSGHKCQDCGRDVTAHEPSCPYFGIPF